MPKYPEFKTKPIKGLEEEDWGKLSAARFNVSINTDWKDRYSNRVIDHQAIADKIDYKAKVAKTDYKAIAAKKDYKAIAAKKDYKAIAAKKHKPVLQFDKQDNFIKEWDSAKEAAIAMGRPGSDDIGAVCRGKQKTAYGFIWKFKSEQN